MIGINTLQQDYPSLTVRQPLSTIDIPNIIQPRPIVIDSKIRFISIEKILLNRPIIFTCYNRRSSSRSSRSSSRSCSRGGSSRRSSSVDYISLDCDHLIDDIVNDHEDSKDEKWMQALDVIRRLDGDLVECKADAMGR
jgi:riboflavin biosynthesis pyrimidine reductase